ncbi:hypothetical protein P3342_004984 [Pyrenophora teres f. teres]|uniref:ribonuclease H n=1 Tax=Pyrenophora teres f. teres TaxID=97479 RepID=A0A6S6VT84_9PLEO|nr:hypothetical protein HRS9139_00983 [Pyrenophora teres f. teres]KAE8848556.1 hypothetical protein PTNB85_02399 [Pyrenophora teres f. teres]KAE8853277.1 hypothetical protein HRS9122_00269 [Pyrenophora teres f. teres]KAE8868481.1 hypothetical protein PTNB29_02392 [Pyrenophora teres f. teres]KAE8873249.1 hypothetical protein PTNB73_02400 [Pyrenophora teres f. teres]
MAEPMLTLEPSADASNCLVCYTDGSALKNKKGETAAGCGVYFGPDDPRNYGEPLGPGEQTNQRAELAALWQGLSCITYNQDVIIWTDSQYAKNTVLVWYHDWKLQDWKSPKGIIRRNLDLIKPIVDILKTRTDHHAKTEICWVKGHAGNQGNEAADKLAGRGSEMAWLQRYGKPYKEPPRKDFWNPVPPGWKLVTRPDGSEEIERIDQETLQRIKSRKEKKAEKRKASWEKKNAARRAGPKNVGERIAAKKAREEAARLLPPPRISAPQASKTTRPSLQKGLARQLIDRRAIQRQAPSMISQQPAPELIDDGIVITGCRRVEYEDLTMTYYEQIPEPADDDGVIRETTKVRFNKEREVRVFTSVPKDYFVAVDRERDNDDTCA